jgi:hypothetical protein
VFEAFVAVQAPDIVPCNVSKEQPRLASSALLAEPSATVPAVINVAIENNFMVTLLLNMKAPSFVVESTFEIAARV